MLACQENLNTPVLIVELALLRLHVNGLLRVAHQRLLHDQNAALHRLLLHQVDDALDCIAAERTRQSLRAACARARGAASKSRPHKTRGRAGARLGTHPRSAGSKVGT